MKYESKTDWKDGDKVPASDFNRIEQGVADASAPVSYNDLTNKPTLLTIGTTATTAKAGNWTPPNVTTSANGLMLATDKLKLDNLKGVVLATRPTITITDPPDDENLQASFDAVLDYIDDILGR